MGHIWRSEENWQELVLSTVWILGSALAVCTLTKWANSADLLFFFHLLNKFYHIIFYAMKLGREAYTATENVVTLETDGCHAVETFDTLWS